MEIKLKGRRIPRNAQGDARFVSLGNYDDHGEVSNEKWEGSILQVFTPDEVVELVNRALYQLEYQRDAHAKYGKERRAKEKALRDELKKQGLDPKKATIDKQLKGE